MILSGCVASVLFEYAYDRGVAHTLSDVECVHALLIDDTRIGTGTK